MAPNIVSDTSVLSREIPELSNRRSEILYDGYFYDVTDFLNQHPGGTVIKYYVSEGEDATQAVQQFHFRSWKKVEGILKGFKKRKAEFPERGLKVKSSRRHESLSLDFANLFEEFKANGYFEPSYREILLRLLECTSLLFISLGLILKTQCETFSVKLPVTMFLGFMLSRHAWLMHEAGHNSIIGNPTVDKMIQMYLKVCVIGSSSSWWNSQHNRHHAMPQRLEHDVDLLTLPYVAFHRRTVKDKKEINNFFVKYQSILYWTLDLFLVTFAWKIVIHPRHLIRKKKFGELFLTFPSCLIISFFFGPPYAFLTAYWLALLLGLNFAISHSHLEVADMPTHWVEYGLTHTINITPNIFVDYWMGYLNYQIEHHLFPSMPQFRQKLITHRVREFAEKHGLPYRVLPYSEGCYLALKNLHEVGKDLTK